MNRLELAQAIEDSLAFLRKDSNAKVSFWGRSPYTCDALIHTLGFVDSLLRSVGPEVLWDSYNAFGDIPAKSRQYARALWLTLLAHLAEEGALTLEGLK